MTARRDPQVVDRLDEANLLVELAPHLEDFYRRVVRDRSGEP